MSWRRLDDRSAGIALVVGYSLLVVVLFRDPSSGVYTVLDRPFRTITAFASGNCLAVTGIAIALLDTPDTPFVTALGVAVFALAVFAIVATVLKAVARLAPDLP